MSHPRNVLVTGSSKGVGRGIALGLAEAGWNVVVNYHGDEAGGRETISMIETTGQRSWLIRADVRDADSVAAMFDFVDREVGSLQGLVCNSGVQTWKSLLDLTVEEWNRTIGTNLTGSFLCTQHAARRMKETGGGSIVTIGSGSNTIPFPNLVDYSASKGGLNQFTRVAAVELGKHRIRVNCVAPGAIEIERTREEAPDYAETWAPLTPMGRVGVPADVARAVVFLLSDEAEFITGQTLYVDGGLWTRGVWPYSINE